MGNYKLGRRFSIDIDRRFFSVFIFGFVCAILLIIAVTQSINITSGIRAYVAGEGYWAKAQKEAVFHLTSYIITEDESDYENFINVLQVNRGDKIARQELLKDDYDYQTAYDGFIMGLNHPDDIPKMIDVFRRFQGTPQIQEAIETWNAADQKIEELVSFADSVKSSIANNEVTPALENKWLDRLEDLDHQLTDLEMQFSSAMGNMARLVNKILRWSTIILGLLIISIGIWITLRFYRRTNTWMKALQKSEEQFKNVLHNSRDVLYKMDLDSRKYVFVSPALQSMLGYSEEEFSEGGVEFIMSKMHPEDKE